MLKKKFRQFTFWLKRHFYLVIIKWRALAPVLCRGEHKFHPGVLGDAVLIPPVEFDDVLAAHAMHPAGQAHGHEPAGVGSEARVQHLHTAVVEVVVVVVADDHGMDVRQVVDAARHVPVAPWPRELHEGGAVAEDGIGEDVEPLHLN